MKCEKPNVRILSSHRPPGWLKGSFFAKGLLEASGQLCCGHELLLMKCNQQPGIGSVEVVAWIYFFLHHIYWILSTHHHSSMFPSLSIARSFYS